MATVIDGKQTAAAVHARVARGVAEFVAETGHTPGLVTILVGEDPASQVYVRSKGERSRELGMASFHEQMPATSSQDEVESAVARWNADERVDGILVQLPLPGDLELQAGAGADRSVQGCRRVPPGQRGPAGGQPAGAASRALRPA